MHGIDNFYADALMWIIESYHPLLIPRFEVFDLKWGRLLFYMIFTPAVYDFRKHSSLCYRVVLCCRNIQEKGSAQ